MPAARIMRASWRFSFSGRGLAPAQALLLVLLLPLFGRNTVAGELDFQGATHVVPFDEEGFSYSKVEPTGPVPRLMQRIDKGEVKLRFDPDTGYLPALLEALKIPRSSQGLVFSKSSLQRDRISPSTPRALYFNDDVYLGYIPGAPIMEITSVDPKLGGVFYSLEQKPAEKPKFIRTEQCLECHASAKTMGVPGHIVRSFTTDEAGSVDLTAGLSVVNHRTPLPERWGGWYVTGLHGKQTHRGNLIGAAAFARQEKEPNFLGNQTNLVRFFDTSRYPVGTSDIVALMVLEHETHMHNFLTRLNYESTQMLQRYGHIRYLGSILDAFMKYLLFVEEAPIASPIQGSAEFAAVFQSGGPKDAQGRSLRELDLQTRLFKYPCSFLIHSDAFEGLPKETKSAIYQRLWDILNARNTRPEFQKLDKASRDAIREILAATKRDLPKYWK